MTFTLLGSFFVVGEVLADWTFEETFNGLFDGPLHSQNSWIEENEYYLYLVQSIVSFEGIKGVYISNPTENSAYIIHTGMDCEKGIVYLAIRCGEKGNLENERFVYFFRDSEGQYMYGVGFRIRLSNEVGAFELMYDVRAAWKTLTTPAKLDTWYIIAFKWEKDQGGIGIHKSQTKWKEQGKEWSEWTSWEREFMDTNGTIDTILLWTDPTWVGYFDTISPIDYTEIIPTCNYGSNCQYCYNEESCLAKSCYWSENFCWWILPPELPELEDCSELGITDRLLCEIKNFFYRFFVPSQAKITELRAILDTIKTKFPYNYILETKDFFIYLKDNINENDTTFKILGQTGTINFAFWNTTTTLAGYTQNFLDIFKKITSFVIILVLILWFFSFLKRIFK